jgi:hypothetical protein
MGHGLPGSALELHLQPDNQGPPFRPHSCHWSYRVDPCEILTQCYGAGTGPPAEEAHASTPSGAAAPSPRSAAHRPCYCQPSYYQRRQHGHCEPAHYDPAHYETFPFKAQEETWQKLIFTDPCNFLMFHEAPRRCLFLGLLSSLCYPVSFRPKYCISVYRISPSSLSFLVPPAVWWRCVIYLLLW